MDALGFLVFGCLFMATLFRSLFQLFNHDWDTVGFSGMEVIKIMKWPIISFILLILFIAYGLPLIKPGS